MPVSEPKRRSAATAAAKSLFFMETDLRDRDAPS